MSVHAWFRIGCAVRAAAILLLAAAAWPARDAAAQTVRVGGTGSALAVMRMLSQAYRQTDPRFELLIVPNLGSSGGMRALDAGALDAALTSRDVTADERRAGLVAREYGRTPVVLATARAGVAGLSRQQIADLYAGRTAQWPDGTPVRVVLRPASDIDTQVLAGMSPAIGAAQAEAAARPGMQVAVTDQDAASDIARLPGAIGTTSLALILAENRPLFPIPVDGVTPSVATLADGTYPYAKSMYVVVKGTPPAALLGFIDFLYSARGRALLQKTGHRVAPDPPPRNGAPGLPPRK